MSGLGGNLNYKERPLLITNLTVADIGAYEQAALDGMAAVKHLVIKKAGLDMAYDSSVKFQKSCTQEGALKSVLLKVEAPCPCQDCNASFGFDVIKKVKNPGVLNDDVVKKTRFYGHDIESLATCSNGQIADADKLAIEDDILGQIKVDRGFGSREESIVDGKRIYLVTPTQANTDEINVTIAGATTNIHLDGGVTIHTAVEDFNTDATAASLGLVAFAKNATQMYITSEAIGTIFTIADGGGASTVVIAGRYMWLYSRDVDVQFEVQWTNGFLSLGRFNVLVLANAYTAGTTMFSIDGTNSDAIVMAAHSHDCVTNIANDAHLGTASGLMYASTEHSGDVGSPIWIYSGVKELKIKTLSTGVTVSGHYSGHGVYANLTWEDVFREFSEYKHLNGLTHLVPLTQPQAGDKYCKLTITRKNEVANMHGASHFDGYLETLVIYLKQGFGAANLWDASGYMWESTADNTFFAVDSDINDLLAYFGIASTAIA